MHVMIFCKNLKLHYFKLEYLTEYRSIYFEYHVLHTVNDPDLLLRKDCLGSDKEDRFKAEHQWAERGHISCGQNQYH